MADFTLNALQQYNDQIMMLQHHHHHFQHQQQHQQQQPQGLFQNRNPPKNDGDISTKLSSKKQEHWDSTQKNQGLVIGSIAMPETCVGSGMSLSSAGDLMHTKPPGKGFGLSDELQQEPGGSGLMMMMTMMMAGPGNPMSPVNKDIMDQALQLKRGGREKLLKHIDRNTGPNALPLELIIPTREDSATSCGSELTKGLGDMDIGYVPAREESIDEKSSVDMFDENSLAAILSDRLENRESKKITDSLIITGGGMCAMDSGNTSLQALRQEQKDIKKKIDALTDEKNYLERLVEYRKNHSTVIESSIKIHEAEIDKFDQRYGDYEQQIAKITKLYSSLQLQNKVAL
eukprot:CAMPEP_0118705948 /NCGR_PEP_ID=MMETSP0800-20121206/20225_1 /TAXON_ID=210618 ORGANISM="Striatella unipunctata, Strain CCMP2910" /NCGR_SAMPLE_ID=MMETSP0800 /ASSEMBLY_ACC=CAM_ASM_000638 /LENGTH=344 /DNA_ID=CAMNT_0006608307 /DNA_START=342 /DNA_END=1375 /DNA_ORIENTATION=-